MNATLINVQVRLSRTFKLLHLRIGSKQSCHMHDLAKAETYKYPRQVRSTPRPRQIAMPGSEMQNLLLAALQYQTSREPTELT